MASMESRGLMLFTIEIMKGEIDLVRALAAHAGLYQLPDNAMHRFAIGDPQCISHELFADFRNLDGRWRTRATEALSAGCGSFGLVSCSDRR